MDKKRILIVGFGGIGCRHAQSFLDKKKDYEVHILEPSDENIKQNLKRINAKKSDFTWYKDIDNVPVLDIAIVATSSFPRFKIVKNLVVMGYKKFLLEKIVFQSEEQIAECLKEIIINYLNMFIMSCRRKKCAK